MVNDKIDCGEISTQRVHSLAEVFRFEVSRKDVCPDDRSLQRMFEYIVLRCEEVYYSRFVDYEAFCVED